MKLKTEFQDEGFEKGEVADVSIATMSDGRIIVRAKAKRGGEHTFYYDSLEVLYNDWSDCEEPKAYWYIAYNGTVGCFEYNEDCQYMDFNWQDKLKQIGNYFETKEEAELAVRKLEAWKRLKDKGFRFIEGYLDNNDDFIIKAKLGHVGLIDQPDVSLLFGGEE